MGASEARKRMNMLERIDEFAHLFLIFDDFGELSPSSDTFSDLIQLIPDCKKDKASRMDRNINSFLKCVAYRSKGKYQSSYSFHAASKSISRIVIDDAGAESLKCPRRDYCKA